MKTKLDELLSIIKQNYTDNAKELAESLGLVELSLSNIFKNFNRDVTVFIQQRQFDKSKEVINWSEELSNIQNKLNGIISQLIINESPITVIKEKQPFHEQTNPEIPHSLSENFTFKKPVGFSMDGIYHTATSWKQILMDTCNILSKTNKDKFYELADDPEIKKQKQIFFGRLFIKTNGIIRNTKMEDINIFVLTNLSSMNIIRVIIMVLKKFEINTRDFEIFLKD